MNNINLKNNEMNFLLTEYNECVSQIEYCEEKALSIFRLALYPSTLSASFSIIIHMLDSNIGLTADILIIFVLLALFVINCEYIIIMSILVDKRNALIGYLEDIRRIILNNTTLNEYSRMEGYTIRYLKLTPIDIYKMILLFTNIVMLFIGLYLGCMYKSPNIFYAIAFLPLLYLVYFIMKHGL